MARRMMTRGRGIQSGQRRETRWLNLDATVLVLIAAGGTILYSLTTEEKALRPFTVIRTRLLVQISSDQLAAGENQIGAIGAAVVSDQAVGAGVTAVPTPINDVESDLWFVHQFLFSAMDLASAIGFDGNVGRVYSIDSKAMRKVEDGQDVVVVAEFSTQGDGFTLATGGRVLIKLH